MSRYNSPLDEYTTYCRSEGPSVQPCGPVCGPPASLALHVRVPSASEIIARPLADLPETSIRYAMRIWMRASKLLAAEILQIFCRVPQRAAAAVFCYPFACLLLCLRPPEYPGYGPESPRPLAQPAIQP